MSQQAPLTFYGDSLTWRTVETKDGLKYYVKGYASTSDADLVDDIVTPNALKSMLDQAKNRTIKLDFEHEAFRGKDQKEKSLNITKSPLGKAVDAQIDDKGLMMEWELNQSWKARDDEGRVTKTFAEVWEEVKGEFLDAFSIAFIPVRTAMREVGGKTMRLLDEVRLLNVALTGNPVNPAARMSAVMAKSLEAFQDESHSSQSQEAQNSVDKKGDQMATENQQETFEVKDEIEALKAEVKSLSDKLAEKSESEKQGTKGASEAQPSAAEQKSAEELKSKLDAEVKAREQAEADLKALNDKHEELKARAAEQEKILSAPAVKGFLEQREVEESKSKPETESKAKGPLDLLP